MTSDFFLVCPLTQASLSNSVLDSFTFFAVCWLVTNDDVKSKIEVIEMSLNSHKCSITTALLNNMATLITEEMVGALIH